MFVVHGRNLAARDGVWAFLRAIGLRPLEWSQAVRLTGDAAPFIGQVLDRAFESAQAVVVLLHPDEIAYIRRELADGEDDPEFAPAAQARPNVLFEAGMALGRHPKRTVLVQHGVVRPFSDIAGRHLVTLDNSPARRKELAQRLQTAGCLVDLTGEVWLTSGDLTPPQPPGGGLPLGKREPRQTRPAVRLDARYSSGHKGSGRLFVTNHGTIAVHDLEVHLPPESQPGFHVHAEPVRKLPPGKSVGFIASRSMGPGADHFEVHITAKTPEGDPIEDDCFISLVS